MTPATWTRVALGYLVLVSLQIGAWAQFAPRSFYDDFPGLGRAWVSVDGPYSEHLVRDVGGLYLALTVLLVASIITLSRALVITASAAVLISGVPHLVYHLANRDKQQKNWMNLEPYLQEAVKLAPNSAPSWYYLGYCRLQNNRFKDAMDAYRKADKASPGNAAYLFNIGYCHEQLGDAKAALDHYRKALKAQPDYKDATDRFYLLAIVKRGDIEAASKLFEELITLAPNTSGVHNDYALILRDWAEKNGATGREPSQEVRQRIKRSGEVYEIAARLAPDDPQIQSDTGLLFEFYPCNFDAAKAKRYFTRSLDISGYVYRDAFDGLFRLCVRTGDWTTLRDYAANVVDALDVGGRHAVAPKGSGPPQELPNETPGLLARARSALKQAEEQLAE